MLLSFDSALYDLWTEDRELWLTMANLPDTVSKTDDNAIRAYLQTRLREHESREPTRRGSIFTNIAHLASVLTLTDAEREILTFASIGTRNHHLRAALRAMSVGTREFAIKVLACALALPETEIRPACQRNATLSEIGLLFHEQKSLLDIETVLNLEESVAQHFFTEHESPEAFIRWFFTPVPGSVLEAGDFPHLDQDLRIITRYLRRATETRMPGTNILLYGPPGTGKTQFARLLAKEIGVALYEVGERDDTDSPESGGRLMSYRLCQRFLARAWSGMVLFEEMEDAFPYESGFMGRRGPRFEGNKAPVNRLLEENPVPTIWISNDVGYVDTAYLRRFDYALELTTPPRSVRRKILERRFAGMPLDNSFLNELAACDDLTPAQVEHAAKVVRCADVTTEKDLRETVERVLANNMRLLGQHGKLNRPGREVGFSVNYLNVAADVPQLVNGLKKSASPCRICFYGPPGTGKTSLAHFIAREVDRPLMVRRASDLLGSYVGETERNIAGMFRSARDEGAVLLLDEVDSFLQDRRDALQSWEVTQVNELLTQMERHEGLFICATNLMDRLDLAALRRFDFKLQFDYLTAHQGWELFLYHIEQLGCSTSPDERIKLHRVLESLRNLTPADFSVAARRFGILGTTPSPAALLAGLAEECNAKPARAKQIGFV